MLIEEALVLQEILWLVRAENSGGNVVLSFSVIFDRSPAYITATSRVVHPSIPVQITSIPGLVLYHGCA